VHLAGRGVDGHRAQPLVDGLAVLEAEDRGLADQHRRRPLVDLAAGQHTQRVGHLGHRLREPEVPRTLRGGTTSRECHLVGDPTPAPVPTCAVVVLRRQL
jgi:hypothetical protein